AAGLAAAIEKIGERHFRERLVLKVEIARAEKPSGAEVREGQVFVVAEIFFDLGNVVFRVRIAAPKRIQAVAQEQRFEFELHRLAHSLGEHEINEAFRDSDLSCRLKSEHVLAKRGEQI